MLKANELERIITYHINKYPLMEIIDIIKLIYQSEFGGGHLVESISGAVSGIVNEAKSSASGFDDELMEYIGGGICRIYIDSFLNIFSSRELAAKILAAMFAESAAIKKGDTQSYQDKLNLLLSMIKNDAFSMLVNMENPPLWAFDFSASALAVARQKDEDYPIPRHSEAYRNAYSPAYRIVLNEFYRYISLFEAIELLAAEKTPVVIGIDGKCGSGKTTLARMLHMAFDCQLILMDDFFLPGELRSEERYLEPGGNVHYERFLEEVVTPINSKAAEFSYRSFNCKTMDYEESRKLIKSQGIILVEGSYAMRPEFRDIYDLKVFLDISSAEQEERIKLRNGPEAFKMFESKWIPLENNYFNNMQVDKFCDFIYASLPLI